MVVGKVEGEPDSIQINPINFFQRDLSNKEYEKLIEEGSKKRESLD